MQNKFMIPAEEFMNLLFYEIKESTAFLNMIDPPVIIVKKIIK